MKLVTSNQKKLAEFQRYGLKDIEIAEGKDLREIKSADPAMVVMYKALEAGPGHVVEDTSLKIEGVEVGTDVRWLMDTVKDYAGRRADWCVFVAHNTGEVIKVTAGYIHGTIVAPEQIREGAFGFDPYFIPDGEETGLTLDQLEQSGRKDDFSARQEAVERLLAGIHFGVYPVADMRPWDGEYQTP